MDFNYFEIKFESLIYKNINQSNVEKYDLELVGKRFSYPDYDIVIIDKGIFKNGVLEYPIKKIKLLLPDKVDTSDQVPNKHITNYVNAPIQFLGKGTYGKVTRSGKYAIKTFLRLDTDSRTPYLDFSFLRETTTLIHLKHPNIINLIDVVSGEPENINSDLVSIILPLANFNLIDYYKIYGKSKYLSIIYQILKGFNYIHSKDIIHGDIKGDNILINIDSNNEPHVLISDFGFSLSSSCKPNPHHLIAYSIYFRPLELVFNLGYGLPADIWAVGCLIYYCYTGDHLFYDHVESLDTVVEEIFHTFGPPLDYPELYDKVKNKYIFRYNIKTAMDKVRNDDIYAIIIGMLKYNPYDRLPFSEALLNPIFSVFHSVFSDYNKVISELECPGIIEKRQKYQIISSIDDLSRIQVSEKLIDKLNIAVNAMKYDQSEMLSYFDIMYIFDYTYPGHNFDKYIFLLACADIYMQYKYNRYLLLTTSKIKSEDKEYYRQVDDMVKIILKVLGYDLIVSTLGTFLDVSNMYIGRVSVEKRLVYKYLPIDISYIINIMSNDKYKDIYNDLIKK